jgi:hypothetical protein
MSSVWIGTRDVTKGEQNEVKLEIGLPSEGFPNTLYFNRFRVEREGEVCLLQFGLVSGSTLLGSYTCAFPQDALHQNQKSLLDYLNKTGRPATSPTEWKGAPVEKQAEVADVIAMAFRGGMAETCFYVFSLCAATRVKKAGSETINSQPLALLRSSAELQKQLIVALYEE